MTAHRVTLLRSSLRRYPDPARSRDPQVRALISQLSELSVAPAPEAKFRSELRAQLVAVTPRMVAEGAEEIAREAAASPAGEARPAHAERRAWFGKSLKLATAALVVVLLALGGTVWLSRSALPGDSLYGVKRASENVQLALDSSDTSRADDYLQFAQTRTDEVRGLLDRSKVNALGSGLSAASAVDAATAALIVQTLQSSNDDVRSAASLLNRAALTQHSVKPLQTMTTWARGQLNRLAAIWTDLPLGNLRAQATASQALVVAAAHRATALHSLATCKSCTPRTGSDPLGPLPCTNCTTTVPGTGTGNGNGTPGSTPTSRPGVTQPNGSAPAAPGGNGRVSPSGQSSGQSGTLPGTGIVNPPAPNTSSPGGATTHPTLPVPLPSLPTLPVPSPTTSKSTTGAPKLPIPKVSVGSCGASISVGGIGVGLGSCSGG